MNREVRARAIGALIGLVSVGSLYASDTTTIPAVAVATAILIVLAVWQPVVILGLTTAMLPLYHQPIEFSDTVLAPSELLLAAAASGTAVRALASLMRSRHEALFELPDISGGLARLNTPFGRVATGSLALLALVGLILLLSIDDSVARSAGLREWRWTLVQPLIFVALLLWNSTSPRDRHFIVGSFAVGGLFIAIWSLTDTVSGGGVSAGGVTRASAPFPHPNALGLYLLRPVVLGAAYLLISRNRAVSPWAACGIGAAALVASFSRSAALGLIVAGLLVWPWLSRWLRVAAASGAAIVALALVTVAGDRAVGSSGQDSLALRVDIWRSGLEMIRDRPILGYGPDQFLYTYAPRYASPTGWDERFTSHGHNFLIDGWVRVGIIGAVLGLLALVVIGRAALRKLDGPGREQIDPLTITATVALAAAGAQGLVDNGYFVHDLAMSAWLLGWIAFSAPATEGAKGAFRDERRRDRRRWTSRLSPVR